MTVLVLGAYGLVGSAITRALLANGQKIRGVGRITNARLTFPEVEWVLTDLREMTSPEDWEPMLSGISAVVNAAGALQDGPKDDLDAVQHRAIAALAEACERRGVRRFIQISAPGADPQSPIKFLSTKGLGDAAVRSRDIDWVVFKPGLVLSEAAYGGTALIRMLAALPVVQPFVEANQGIQTIDIADLCQAVLTALHDPAVVRRDFDLLEEKPHDLTEIIGAYRQWLGFAPAPLGLKIPRILSRLIGEVADFAGMFGWRSPLRSTALDAIEAGVVGDGTPWQSATDQKLKPLDETLSRIPATPQERIFARTRLMFPVAVITLSLFWLASGLIGLLQWQAAVEIASNHMGPRLALFSVLGGAIADVLVGLGFIWRDTFILACVVSVFLALFYLVAGTFWAPELWLHPLGVYVKILPALVLAPLAAATMETR